MCRIGGFTVLGKIDRPVGIDQLARQLASPKTDPATSAHAFRGDRNRRERKACDKTPRRRGCAACSPAANPARFRADYGRPKLPIGSVRRLMNRL